MIFGADPDFLTFLVTILGGFWDDFGYYVCIFFESLCGARPRQKHGFDIVFAMFQAHLPFQEKLKKLKNA